jgi:hypothetical protein
VQNQTREYPVTLETKNGFVAMQYAIASRRVEVEIDCRTDLKEVRLWSGEWWYDYGNRRHFNPDVQEVSKAIAQAIERQSKYVYGVR